MCHGLQISFFLLYMSSQRKLQRKDQRCTLEVNIKKMNINTALFWIKKTLKVTYSLQKPHKFILNMSIVLSYFTPTLLRLSVLMSRILINNTNLIICWWRWTCLQRASDCSWPEWMNGLLLVILSWREVLSYTTLSWLMLYI